VNVRTTHSALGPVRADDKILPGDQVVLSFDIANPTADHDGKVRYSIEMEVTDSRGTVLFKQEPREMEATAPSGSHQLPACAVLDVGTEQPAGDYTVKLIVKDRTSGAQAEITRTYHLLPKGFGLVRYSTTAGPDAKSAVAALRPRKSGWINFSIVGFTRDTAGQPDVELQMRILSADGQPVLKGAGGEVKKDVPERAKAIHEQFEVVLPQPGTFTVELTATDKLSGTKASLTAPLTVSEDRGAQSEVQAAANCISAPGTIAVRRAGQAEWHPVMANEKLGPGDLLVGFPGASIDSENGAVRMTMLSDLDRNSPYPVIENAVILHAGEGADLNFTLDRGRVDVTNRKENGAARVHMRLRDDVWDLTLSDPGTRVAFETYGRWPRGVRFRKEVDPKNAPTSSLVILVLKGTAHVAHKGYQTTMHAPPGPAMWEWDSITGADESPVHLAALPAWAQSQGESSPLATAKKAIIERFRESMLGKGIDQALDVFIESADVKDRTLAVFVMGALDKLPRLGKALREAKHPDVWDNGVVALRHWVGRRPGQDQILYHALMEKVGFSPHDAEAVLQLLHSFGDEDLARPETYQTLVDYLDHNTLAIRGLAYWHLYRLVPAGRAIAYNPLAPKEERDAAAKKWQELIPPGTIPARTPAEPMK
jgi:hypothetical protein